MHYKEKNSLIISSRLWHYLLQLTYALLFYYDYKTIYKVIVLYYYLYILIRVIFVIFRTSYSSVLIIVAFSMERYLAICHPLYSHTMSGFKRAIRIIILVWLLSMISGSISIYVLLNFFTLLRQLFVYKYLSSF